MVKGIMSRKRQQETEWYQHNNWDDIKTSKKNKIPNWKSPWPHGVEGYWLKKLTALHGRIAKQMDNIISNREDMIKAWIDYKKTYDKVNHSWILESLELVQVSDNICEFVKISMANWQTELTACKESLAKVNITRGIFQGDSLSPLLFAICMILLTHVLCKTRARYT